MIQITVTGSSDPASLRTTAFPPTGRPLGAVGLGCAGLSKWMYDRPRPDDESAAVLLRTALDHGVTLFDTAGVYGEGHNETLIGRALSDCRNEVFLATKVGLVVDDLESFTLHNDGSPAHLRKALDESLRRLRTETVDLCYLHRIDPDVPLEDSWATLAELVRDGKIRHLGLSEVSVLDAERAHRIHPVAAIQSELSLWARQALGHEPRAGTSYRESIVGWCADHRAAFVPYAPLGRGFLAGAISPATFFGPGDLRSRLPRFTPHARAANQRIVTVLERVAQRHRASPAQVALAWILAQGEHVIPIPSTTRTRHLEDNLHAATLNLTPRDLADIDGAPPAAEDQY
ncbi:aldo/keto reductase [Streptomyces sp. NRRL WC-3742]|uniref:aldo/keto reductase n=1 Tax=Streptomyces sp. NRRL WC-3742 TaxID=1463934 RepID=UPI00068C86C2|nr:aldo/keto reductase [Streptomyces sp. NRRL WC-3742]